MARLQDVADLAGVSLGTASKVLNGRQGAQKFSPECEQRVRRAAERLGYRPSYMARSLANRRAEAVGLLIGPGAMGANDFWGEVLRGLGMGAIASGRHLVTVAGHDADEQCELAGRFLQEGRIDGLVVLSFRERFRPPPCLTATGHPLVLLGCRDPAAPSVALDDDVGVEAVVQHLADLGHRRITWYGPEDRGESSCARRRQACRRTAARFGLELAESMFCWEPAMGDRVWTRRQEEQVARVCAHCCGQAGFAESGTAAVCYDDVVAFGVYGAARERGLRIPDDLSVTGFDDIHADCVWPALTTVNHMLTDIGQRAAALLEAMIEDPTRRTRLAGHCEMVRPRLRIRASTAPPRRR